MSQEFAYALKFDVNIQIPDTWVDGRVMNYFNKQRDNIFASSSKYDIVQLRQGESFFHTTSENTNEEQKQKQRLLRNRNKNMSVKKRTKSMAGAILQPSPLIPPGSKLYYDLTNLRCNSGAAEVLGR